MIDLKPGTLVKISDEGSILKGEILAWYRINEDVRAHLFHSSEVYGMFLGNPIKSNNVYFYEILIGKRKFLISENQFKQLETIIDEDGDDENQGTVR